MTSVLTLMGVVVTSANINTGPGQGPVCDIFRVTDSDGGKVGSGEGSGGRAGGGTGRMAAYPDTRQQQRCVLSMTA